MPKDALIVFLKEPVAGKVKTRLGKDIGNDAAASIYSSFLKELNQKFKKIANEIDIHFFYSGSAIILKEIFHGFKNWHQQIGVDLGLRMANAFEKILLNYKKVTIIGSDTPHLDMNYIKKSISVLNYVDLAIGKSDDGGYYLLSLKRIHPFLFENMSWSTETVYQDTMTRAHENNLEVFELPVSYDIDTLDSLKRLNDSTDIQSLKFLKEKLKSLHF